jgi:predicted RNase H-like HicB family nuclease
VHLTMICEQEHDGRWLANVPELPGVHTYGVSPVEAQRMGQVLALSVLGEMLEAGELMPQTIVIDISPGPIGAPSLGVGI